MPRAARALAVWANGLRVGEWRAPARGHAELQYDEAWLHSQEARPLSLSLQLARLTHKNAAVDAYFDNLLPDSESIRRRLQERFHTESRGAFDLLAAIGRDCVGAVQLLPPGQSPVDLERVETQSLTSAQIERELAGITLPRAPGEDTDDFRISIAGAQEKTAFHKRGNHWCRPVGSTPTTHIFKLPLGLVGNRQADMRTSVENEWLCARIAAAFELPVASCEIAEFGALKTLIVERFDRQLHSSGKYWLRLMQEDFCQATGTPFHRKYQSDGGPGLTEIARILRGSDGTRDLETLFRAQVLFYLLAATDGHAKNFSIRLLAGTRFRLTPLYDVLSAWPVIGKRANQLPYEKARLAMALPGSRPLYHLKAVQRRHFLELGRRLGLGEATEDIIAEMVGRVPAVVGDVSRDLPRAFPERVFDAVAEGMRRHARVLERAASD